MKRDAFKIVVEEESEDFISLVNAAGLSPEKDFMNVDLSGIEFGNADLRKFRFKESNLNFANLTKAKIGHDTIWGASLLGTRLPTRTLRSPLIINLNLRLLIKDKILSKMAYGSHISAAKWSLSQLYNVEPYEIGKLIIDQVDDEETLPQQNLNVANSRFTFTKTEYDKIRRIREDTNFTASHIVRFLIKFAIRPEVLNNIFDEKNE